MKTFISFIYLTSLTAVLILCPIYYIQAQALSETNRIDRYAEVFNEEDHDTIRTYITNDSAAAWMKKNIPYFECSDANIERTYYFRWWAYRKHIEHTPEGFVITEFLPNVPWAGKYNTISCAAGHHFYEGRWIRNPVYMHDYASFWFRNGAQPRLYSFWAADALYNLYLVQRDTDLIENLLPDLVKNYEGWEREKLDSTGLFWQIDDRDGMEKSIGGNGYRPTINSYMYGDALAISKIASFFGKTLIAQTYRAKANQIKAGIETRLWDNKDYFFKVLPRGGQARLQDVKELIGYVPWYFNIPDTSYASAWKYLMDPNCFFAPYGPTTADRGNIHFMFKDAHECLWNGPSWPYATTQTLIALANLLNGPKQPYISRDDYYTLFSIYTHSQKRTLPTGKSIPWIDEDLDPFSGIWLARSILHRANRWDKNRGEYYNHSGYADLVITGLVGLRPRPDNMIEINPLLPPGKWDYFLLKGISYHGHLLKIIYDFSGMHYKMGKGLFLFVDGKLIKHVANLSKIKAQIPVMKKDNKTL